MARLARLTDPRALDVEEGARARCSAEVPQSWLDDGAEIELALPKVLVCARCDGGGCDSCGKSGALRAPAEADARRVRLHLPRAPGRVRLVDPFQDGCIAQLLVELRAGEPSPMARRILAPRRSMAPRVVLAAVALALLLALAAWWW